MKYQIEISGMHCSGCKNLITMSLEDAGFTAATVNLTSNTAQFETDKTQEEITIALNEIFAELQQYKFSNLQQWKK
jgi:copper chaperone CopZ